MRIARETAVQGVQGMLRRVTIVVGTEIVIVVRIVIAAQTIVLREPGAALTRQRTWPADYYTPKQQNVQHLVACIMRNQSVELRQERIAHQDLTIM